MGRNRQGRQIRSRYILFTGVEHDIVQLDFTEHQIDTFITLWNDGLPIQKISRKINTSKVSVALIAMDLEMTGKIKAREGGLFGSEKVVS